MRLNKFLAKCGIGSRRSCDEFIKNGKIKINGKIVSDFSYQVNDNDYVQYDNKYVEVDLDNYYYILNKPKSYVCSKKDDAKRKIIYDLMPQNCRLFSVGRLDYDTTGIILLTNDGDFCQKLSHPKNKVKKKYYVTTDDKLNKNQILEISRGIRIDRDRMSGNFLFLDKIKKNYLWDITLTEGKNREIKRIFNNFNIKVLSIHRYEFAGFKLGHLKEGKFRLLKKSEIKGQNLKYK